MIAIPEGFSFNQHPMDDDQHLTGYGHLGCVPSPTTNHSLIEGSQLRGATSRVGHRPGQYPTQPSRALFGEMAMIGSPSRGVGRRYKTCPGTELLGTGKTIDIPNLAQDQESRVVADAWYGSQKPCLWGGFRLLLNHLRYLLDQPPEGVQQGQQLLQSQLVTRSEMETLQKLTSCFPKEVAELLADAVPGQECWDYGRPTPYAYVSGNYCLVYR